MPLRSPLRYAIDISTTPPGDLSEDTPSPPLGTLLEPTLRNACGEDRLSEIRWFRTDWQRGGAATGYADWTNQAGEACPVVVKLPVPPAEGRWLARLQPEATGMDAEQPVVPQLYAQGETLNGYDLCWVVMERLNHGPLGQDWPARGIDHLIEAAGRFYAAAHAASTRSIGAQADHDSFPKANEPVTDVSDEPVTHAPDWSALLRQARDRVRHRGKGQPLLEADRWKKALKAADRRLPKWVEHWHARETDHWCHGDLHHANAMSRTPPPDGQALLLDLALMRPGHWVEDAIYLEHLHWARPDDLEGRKPAKQLAQHRKSHGLPLGEDWAELAQTYRALLAMATPVQNYRLGDPRHLTAALEILEQRV